MAKLLSILIWILMLIFIESLFHGIPQSKTIYASKITHSR